MTLFRLLSTLFVALFLSFPLIKPALAQAKPRFGLWIEAEGQNRPWQSKKNIEEYLEYSKDPRLTDLYCQIYRNGRAWFPSLMADDAPYRNALKQGYDPMRATINAAHKRGQRVHAWFNVLRIISNRGAPLLRTIGEEAVLRDSAGNSLLSYNSEGIGPGAVGKAFQLGTPGYWLEPGSMRVREYIVETIRDFLIAYPDIDGIHLDMVRFPISMRQRGKRSKQSRPSFGYSEESLHRFFEFTGRTPPPVSPAMVRKLRKVKAWHTWKRAQVTLLVFQVKELLNRIAPEVELSSAVVASPERSYHEAFQDWSEWLKGGIIDTAVPMAYTRDAKVIRRYSKHAVRSSSGADVLVGLGAWLMKRSPGLLVNQGEIALEAGADGVVLFSYSNLHDSVGRTTFKRFGESVFPTLK